MLTSQRLTEVEDAIERIEAAMRGIDALIATERDLERLNNDRITRLRKIKGSLDTLSGELEKLYD